MVKPDKRACDAAENFKEWFQYLARAKISHADLLSLTGISQL